MMEADPEIEDATEPEYTRLAWELARRASFNLTDRNHMYRVCATLTTHAGDISGFGRTTNEALGHLAEGLDRWAEEWKDQPIPDTNDDPSIPTFTVDVGSV